MAGRNDLTNALLEAHHLLRCYNLAWYRKKFGGLDPKQGQGRILSALYKTQGITQKELGLMLDIRPQPLGELLQKLEAHGYIERYRSEADKRTLIVELTMKGEAFQMIKPDYDELFIDLNMREKAALKEYLEKISERLTEMLEKETEDEFY